MAQSESGTCLPIQCSSPPDSTETPDTAAENGAERLLVESFGNNTTGESQREMQTLLSFAQSIAETLPDVVKQKKDLEMQRIHHKMEIEDMQHQIKITQLRSELEYLESMRTLRDGVQGELTANQQLQTALEELGAQRICQSLEQAEHEHRIKMTELRRRLQLMQQ